MEINNKKIVQKLTRGFTLLELLIYIAILSVIMIVTSNMFISLSKGQGQIQAKSEVDSSLRFVTEMIRQDIKNASAVSTPSLGVPSSTLSLTRSGTTILYDVVGGILRRKEVVSSPVNVTNSNINISAPTFTRIENTNTVFSKTNVAISLNIPFSYNSTSPDWSYSAILKTTVSLYSN